MKSNVRIESHFLSISFQVAPMKKIINTQLRLTGSFAKSLCWALLSTVALVLSLPVYAEDVGGEKLSSESAQLFEAGKYSSALSSAQEAVRIGEKQYGQGSPHLIPALRNLAKAYEATWDKKNAEQAFNRIFEIVFSHHLSEGKDGAHPETADSLIEVGEFYRRQRQYELAATVVESGTRMRENIFGPNDPSVALALNNLGRCYEDWNRSLIARVLYLRAYEIDEQSLSPDDPQAAITLTNLANLSQKQGKYAEAETLYRRGLALREKAFGPNDRQVVESLNGLASLAKDQGKYADAEALYLRVLAIEENALGSKHPLLVNTLDNLSEIYEKLSNQAKSTEFWGRARAISRLR